LATSALDDIEVLENCRHNSQELPHGIIMHFSAMCMMHALSILRVDSLIDVNDRAGVIASECN
jgi:hypothetical protein